MAMKFYKKLVPKTPVILANGSKINFMTLNLVTGYYATENEWVQNQMRSFIERQQYGITEITEGEFHEHYVQKKTTSPQLKKLWRDEVGGVSQSALSQLDALKKSGALEEAAVANPIEQVRQQEHVTMADEELPVAQAVIQPPPPPQPAAEFKPTTGKRKKFSDTKDANGTASAIPKS